MKKHLVSNQLKLVNDLLSEELKYLVHDSCSFSEFLQRSQNLDQDITSYLAGCFDQLPGLLRSPELNDQEKSLIVEEMMRIDSGYQKIIELIEWKQSVAKQGFLDLNQEANLVHYLNLF